MKFVVARKVTEIVEYVKFYEVEADSPNGACDAVVPEQEPIQTIQIKDESSGTYSGPVMYAEQADEKWMKRIIANYYR